MTHATGTLLLTSALATLAACPVVCPGGPDPGADAGPPGVNLTVEKTGDGAGSFRSDPDGIDCDDACDSQSITVVPGTAMSVRVEPARDANLIAALCAVTFPDGATAQRELVDDTIAAVAADDPVDTIVTCHAEFRQVHTLQVFFSGQGSGTVVGSLTTGAGGGAPRIDCPDDCIGAYFVGEVDTLTPTPDPGSVFLGWAIDCSGTGPVELTMVEDKDCEAQFGLE